jgi:hypothetical protein
MSTTTEPSRRTSALGDADRSLGPHFGALVAGNKDLLILCAFVVAGFVMVAALFLWVDPEAWSVPLG